MLFASIAGVACSSEGNAASEPPREELDFEVLYVGSDTTGALRGRDRLGVLPAQLARGSADVLCLQGVGAPADRANLRAALASVYPVSLELPTDDDSVVDDPRDGAGIVPPPDVRPPCKDLDQAVFARVVDCLSRCVRPGDLALASDGCLDDGVCAPDSLFAADPERRCRSCISAHGRTGSPVAEIAERCREKVHPLGLHGQHGMMILSKLPLSRPSIHILPAEGIRRAIVGATATTPRGAQVDVFCATLGPTQASALPTDPRVNEPYPGPYGAPRDGWMRENELQIEKLGAHVTSQRGPRPAIVLGNFGVSAEVVRAGTLVLPATGPLGAARLEQLFVSGVASSYGPGCTVCSDNPLTYDAPPTFENRIYLAGLGPDAARASLRNYLGAVVEPDPTGSARPVPISMQFGFRSRIALPTK
jgi:hypothetical protein